MGMDVYGKNPSNGDGEYFRANVWSWRPIYSLTVELCSDLLDAKTINEMAVNQPKRESSLRSFNLRTQSCTEQCGAAATRQQEVV